MGTFQKAQCKHSRILEMPRAILQPWIERYRPRRLADLAYQEEVVSTLLRALDSADMPHMLFYGPPGTGKTSAALAIARQLYGPELMKTRVLELNASDARGIHIVREKIKGFASQTVGVGVANFPCPPYKIIILDEADNMTSVRWNQSSCLARGYLGFGF